MTDELIRRFAALPGVGEKTAEKFAFFVLNQSDEDAFALARAIKRAKTEMRPCSVCCNVSDRDPCPVCADPSRDRSVVCVVETSRDLIAMERTGAFRGVYHVLGGRIAPLEGMAPEGLSIKGLLARLSGGDVKEVVLATNPTLDGDATALHLAACLKDVAALRVTRIATGVPSGANIEHVSRAILAEAFEHRKHFERA